MCVRPAVLTTGVAAVVMFLPSPSDAFECPKHIDAAQAQIQKVEQDMHGMEQMMSQDDIMLVHALLDDAKMLLDGARHNHERPQGPYDHGRAIAKAQSARGYAEAADILHFRYMQQ